MEKTKLTVDLPMDLKTELKVHCAAKGIPMTVVIEDLIRGYLETEQLKKEVKATKKAKGAS